MVEFQPTSKFPLLWRALAVLLIFMIFGPVIQLFFYQCFWFFFDGHNNQNFQLNHFIEQRIMAHLSLGYTLFLPGMAFLAMILAGKILRNHGLSLLFTGVVALVVCVGFLILNMVIDHRVPSFTNIVFELVMWPLSAFICWNFSRMFKADKPLDEKVDIL